MGFHYKNGDYVGGCGAQIGGLVGIIVVGLLTSAGIGVGWAIIIVIIAIIIIFIIHDQINNKNE